MCGQHDILVKSDLPLCSGREIAVPSKEGEYKMSDMHVMDKGIPRWSEWSSVHGSIVTYESTLAGNVSCQP